jgi:hypothetical protein
MEKDGFILYKGMCGTLKRLTKTQKGNFLEAVLAYQLDDEIIEIKNETVQAIFDLFLNQFELDDAKYANRCRSNAKNGRQGGRPPAENRPPEENKAEKPDTPPAAVQPEPAAQPEDTAAARRYEQVEKHYLENWRQLHEREKSAAKNRP